MFCVWKWSSLPQAAGVLTQRSLTLLESSFAPQSLLGLHTQVKKKMQDKTDPCADTNTFCNSLPFYLPSDLSSSWFLTIFNIILTLSLLLVLVENSAGIRIFSKVLYFLVLSSLFGFKWISHLESESKLDLHVLRCGKHIYFKGIAVALTHDIILVEEMSLLIAFLSNLHDTSRLN